MVILLKGILIGLLFGVPAGAVGAMTVQRTFHSGVWAGLLTGLGSSVADCFYACVGVFGLTFVSDFLLKEQNMIHFIGGCLIFVMGVHLLCRKAVRTQKQNEGETEIFYTFAGKQERVFREDFGIFLSSFAVGITNPAAILTFLLAFSWFGIQGKNSLSVGCLLVAGIFVGTYFWWGLLTAGTQILKRKARFIDLKRINIAFGILLSAIGLAVLAGSFV